MEPVLQNNDTAAQWWADHPAFLALCLCVFGLATVTAAWWIGILSASTAQVIGVIYVACLYGFLMVHFRVNVFISHVKFVWFCLAAIWGLFNR